MGLEALSRGAATATFVEATAALPHGRFESRPALGFRGTVLQQDALRRGSGTRRAASCSVTRRTATTT
jgi:16S rRNA G966 N2-methylase RsmD